MAPHLLASLMRFMDGPYATQSHTLSAQSSSTALEASISSPHILNLMHQLYNLEQGDMATTAYLHKAKHVADQLAVAGRAPTLSEFNIFVFKGLRPEFKDLVMILAVRGVPVNFHELHSLLVSHEFIHGNGSFSGPILKGHQICAHDGYGQNTSPICQWCSNPGHTARICSLLQNHFYAPTPIPNLSHPHKSSPHHDHVTQDVSSLTEVRDCGRGDDDNRLASIMKSKTNTAKIVENVTVKQIMKDENDVEHAKISTGQRIKDGESDTKVGDDNSNISRDDFPEGFIFGTATSAYQFEGAAQEGGKGLSVWDVFTTETPDRIFDGSNGNVAVDMYHRYKEDVEMMKKMGFDACRISISWSRILPGGRSSAGINKEGVKFYNDLIDTFLAHGIEPYVTLFHWDLPYCLEQEYAGFLSEKIVDDFRDYVELCFWEFGDRVKSWITLNEPWTYCTSGYVTGRFPPSKPSAPADKIGNNFTNYRAIHDPKLCIPTNHSSFSSSSTTFNPATDAYTVARNLLLAHSAAVYSYRTKFQEHQEGKIGIVVCCQWYEPFEDSSKEDIAASKRAMDFMMGWFLEPILTGRYPQSMIDFVPSNNLIQFSEEESKMLKGSIDFMGLNYYTANYVAHDINPQSEQAYYKDQQVAFYTERDGKPIGPRGGSTWLYVVPWGIYKLLKHINETYKNMPPIYISENGLDELNDFKLTASDACADKMRIKYHQDHLANLLKAIDENVNVRGYFVWAFCDNFEWYEGYTARFGLIYIDYMNNLTRYPKNSAVWFTKFLRQRKNAKTKSRTSLKMLNENAKFIKD